MRAFCPLPLYLPLPLFLPSNVPSMLGCYVALDYIAGCAWILEQPVESLIPDLWPAGTASTSLKKTAAPLTMRCRDVRGSHHLQASLHLHEQLDLTLWETSQL